MIGPFFFENEQGAAVKANGGRYHAMLNKLLFPEIEDDDMDDISFQQDGATCYTDKYNIPYTQSNVTIDFLRTVFENRIMSRNFDVSWPPRSCDLTPLDYFLWGAVKNKLADSHLRC